MLTVAIIMSAIAPAAELPPVGINVNRIGHWQPEYPFHNLAKMTSRWTSSNGHVWNDGRVIPLTTNGYPASLQSDQFARGRVYSQNTGNYDLGRYDLSWDGTGIVRLKSQGTSVRAVTIDSQSAVYDVLNTTATGLLIDIEQTDPADPVRDISLARAGTEGRFNQKFVNALGGFGVIRMMDWQRINNSPERIWNDRTHPDDASWYTVPYEMQIATANAAGSDLWLNVPHAANDDYVGQLATLVRDRLDDDLRVWVENSNEAWNGLFTAKAFYGSQATYGERSTEVFEIFNSVLGNDDRVVNVISGQAASPRVLSTSLANAPTAEVGAINAYFKLSADEYDMIYDDFINGQANKAKVFDLLRADIDEVAAQWQANQNVTERHDVPLVGYEAGVNLTLPAGRPYTNDSAFKSFITSLHTDQRMAELFDYHNQRWQEVGDTLVYYSLAGKWDAAGGLGLVQDFDEPTPKWQRVQHYSGRADWRPGDADLDGAFGTDDLIQVFTAGEYEDDVLCNSGWTEGDWNSDCEFTSADLIAALQAGPVDGQRAAGTASAVPEPASVTLALFCTLSIGRFRRSPFAD